MCRCKDKKKKCCKPECTFPTSNFETFVIEIPGEVSATYTLIAKGNPSNPLAFFVHGFPDSADSWKPLMEIMSQKGYYCVAPYLRGYYPTVSSGIPAVESTIATIVTDLIVLTLNISDPTRENVLIGHDWGAIFGQLVMTSIPHYKKFVSMGNILLSPAFSSLFLFGPDFTYEQSKASFYIYLFQITPLIGDFIADPMINPFNTFTQIDMIKNLWKDGEPEGKFPINVANAEKALLTDVSQQDLKIALNYYRNIFLQINPPAFVQQKTLVFIGKKDGGIVFAKKPDTLKRAIDLTVATKQGEPVEIEVLKCAGHFPQVSFPRKTGKRILQFLA